MEQSFYRAKITHSGKTVEQLYKMQYYVYEKPRMLLRLLIGFGLVAVAVAAGFRDFPAAVRADRALMERKAVLPNMNYSFGSETLRLTGEGSMDIPYKKITRLVEDKQYLYLFLSRNSVCMMEKDSVKPADIMAFAQFMEEKTGLKWRAEKPFLNMSIYDLRQTLKDMRGK